jgi:uncharacterized membrane protein YfcA
VHHHLWLVLTAAAFAAGVINAIAGGGSLLSFPALLLTGMPSVAANATNTLANLPGTITAAWAYRALIVEERRRAWILALPSLLGGLAGSVLLLNTSEKTFDVIVPWLILFACALLALQGPVARLVARATPTSDRHVPLALWGAQFFIAVYGGYFGAGIGILMVAAMAIFLPETLQHANALKVLFATLINAMAAVYFLHAHAVHFTEAGVMALASVGGGYSGARIAQRLNAVVLRALIIVYGVGVAIVLLYRG